MPPTTMQRQELTLEMICVYVMLAGHLSHSNALCTSKIPCTIRMRLTVGHRSGVSGSSSHDLHHSTPYSVLIRLSPQCSARAHHRGSGIVCGISLLSSIRLSFRIFTQLKINFGGLVRYQRFKVRRVFLSSPHAADFGNLLLHDLCMRSVVARPLIFWRTAKNVTDMMRSMRIIRTTLNQFGKEKNQS